MTVPAPVSGFVLTAHARSEMERRGVDEEAVRQVLSSPGQRYTVRPGRDVLQSRTSVSGNEYLIRVFVDIERDPAEVVTVYRTRKVSKYWRQEP